MAARQGADLQMRRNNQLRPEIINDVGAREGSPLSALLLMICTWGMMEDYNMAPKEGGIEGGKVEEMGRRERAERRKKNRGYPREIR